jgi:hypothetical protein
MEASDVSAGTRRCRRQYCLKSGLAVPHALRGQEPAERRIGVLFLLVTSL